MEANQGYASGQQAWARARLQRGRSSGEVWEISAAYPEARLTLGSDGGAGWQIEANGVKPLHCELFWDGSALWLADTHQAGGVFLDGQRVSDWTQVLGPAEIRFGQAALDIETSAPPSQQMQSKPELARPVTVIDTGGVLLPPEVARPSSPGGMVFGGAAGDLNVPDLDAQRTNIARSPLSPDTSKVTAPPALEGVKTQMVQTPESRGLDLRPRLGVSTAAPEAGAPETTKMVSMPVAPPVKAAAPPSLGRPVGVPLVDPIPPTRKAPAAPPPPPPSAAPPPPPSRPVPPPPAPSTTPPPSPAAPAVGGFAAPPEPTEPTEKPPNWFVRTLKHQDSAELTKGKQSLPPRTWGLIVLLLSVTLGWLFWDDTPEVEAAPQPAPGSVVVLPGSGAEGSPDEGTPEGVPDPTPAEGTPAEGTPAEGTPAEGTPTEPTQAAATTDPSDPGGAGSEEEAEGATLQRRAADAYMAGRHADALAHYRQLASQDPESDVWPAMVRMLERRATP